MNDASRRPVGPWLFRPAEPAGDAGGSAHLIDEELAALVEAEHEAVPAATVEHLSRCESCRREAAGLARDAASLSGADALTAVPARHERRAVALVSRGRRAGSAPGRRWWVKWMGPTPILAGLGLAIVLVGIALLRPGSPSGSAPSGPLRARPDEDAIRLLRPAGTVADGTELTFEWEPLAGASAYELVVADPSASPGTILRVRTFEPRHRLDADARARLVAGRRYQWLVRAERGVGRSIVSEPREFLIETR